MKTQVRTGTKLVCKLSEGYDERTRLAVYEGSVIVCHPDFKPSIIIDGELVELCP